MIIPLSSVRCRLPMAVAGASSPLAATRPEARRAGAFSLVELLITMTLLSLIVLALMAVFSSTQTAFRASVTQTDILEGSRATMDLITTDLRTMTPSDGISNYNYYNYLPYGAVNFFSSDNSSTKSLLYQPLLQSLPGTSLLRGNVLNYFFILGRNNQKWTGVGYVVNATNAAPLYPLYRFYAETNIASPPYGLFAAFLNTVNQGQWTNLSHVMDGVVHLAVRPYNLNGYWMTNTYQYYGGILTTNQNIFFPGSVAGDPRMVRWRNHLLFLHECRAGVRGIAVGRHRGPHLAADRIAGQFLVARIDHRAEQLSVGAIRPCLSVPPARGHSQC